MQWVATPLHAVCLYINEVLLMIIHPFAWDSETELWRSMHAFSTLLIGKAYLSTAHQSMWWYMEAATGYCGEGRGQFWQVNSSALQIL